MSLALRPYQQKILDETREAVHAGLNPLIVSPCGSGKGSLVSYIVKNATELGNTVTFAVHGKSLVADMSQRVAKLGIPHGVLMGSSRRERWHPTQVASIDTLHRIEHPPQSDLFIVDEAHGSTSPTWGKSLSRTPNSLVIGMTATPIRLDKKGLGRKTGGLFDVMILGPTVEQLISDGYLVGSYVLAGPPPDGSADIKMKGGNDNLGAQAAVFDKVKLIGDEIKHYQKHGKGGKGVAFCVDQAHANHVAVQFTEAGIPWAYVDADTPLGDENNPQPGTRAKIYQDLDTPNGNLMGVASVGCTSVGWDHPIVSYGAILRMTSSLGLWHQIMGRFSRIFPGKTHFTLADHAGNTLRHAPYGFFEDEIPWCLDGDAIKPGDKKAVSITACKQSVMQCLCADPMKMHEPDGTHWPCYATFKAGPHECPYCRLPIIKKVKKIEIENGDLQVLTRKLKTAEEWRAGTDGDKFAQYMELKRIQGVRGYRPAWASLRYKAMFGQWPRKEWGGFAGSDAAEPDHEPNLFF